MKVPPKRKGNLGRPILRRNPRESLNESPSEKEGKCASAVPVNLACVLASMKVPPKRKGNGYELFYALVADLALPQ